MAALSTSAFTGKALVAKAQIRAKASKASVVVKASASDNKSKAASLLVAGMVALNASPALALNMIELTDQRVTNKEGLQLIYEARDLNIAETTRQDGASRFAFQKLTTAQTAARAKESISRLDQDMATYVNKAYWTQARNELRRQVGTMRFDINNLVENKGSGKEDAKAFYKNVEKLDFAIRQKDKAAATAALAVVQAQGDSLIKSLA
jgi:photosystem II oxygen-evolving enhancer protein 3